MLRAISIVIGLMALLGLVIFFAVGMYLSFIDNVTAYVVASNFQVIVGLPAAAAVAFVLVVFLRVQEGPIQFKGLGFEFQGASGQVVLWTFAFLCIVGAIKLSWVQPDDAVLRAYLRLEPPAAPAALGLVPDVPALSSPRARRCCETSEDGSVCLVPMPRFGACP